MKTSTLQWHLARDDCKKLYNFLEQRGKVTRINDIFFRSIHGNHYAKRYEFDGSQFIEVEIQQGNEENHCQVIDYYLNAE